MKPETYPQELEKFDAVIHTVGALIEGVDYKAPFTSGNPAQSLKTCAMTTLGSFVAGTPKSNTVSYDETLEAKNRDACKLMAENYNSACREASKQNGHFVFISAAPSIAPLLRQYILMKEQAEKFLIHNCP